MTKLLTTAEAAALLSVSEPTLRKLRRAGEIDSIRIGPKAVRYKDSDIQEFINRSSRAPELEPA